MRALRVDDGIALGEVPVPAGAGEALVRVTLSGICNTDVELARGYAGFHGAIGHEFVGVVEDAGGGPLAPGTRVVGEINAGCGRCARCNEGDARHCATRTVLGIVGRDGAHADVLRLPARNLIEVPAAIADASAVFVEPLAAACGVFERCPLEAGMAIAVIGDGKLGLLCAQVLRAHGYHPMLIGKHEAKLELAERLGIQTAPLVGIRHPRVMDVVIEASGAPSGFELALAILKPQGALVLKSTFHGTTPIDSARIVVEELRVIGSRCGRFAPALELLARGAVDVAPLISEVVSLDAGLEAMRTATRPGVLKVLLSR